MDHGKLVMGLNSLPEFFSPRGDGRQTIGCLSHAQSLLILEVGFVVQGLFNILSAILVNFLCLILCFLCACLLFSIFTKLLASFYLLHIIC